MNTNALTPEEALETLNKVMEENRQLRAENIELSRYYLRTLNALEAERSYFDRVMQEIGSASYEDETVKNQIQKQLEECIKHREDLRSELESRK